MTLNINEALLLCQCI